MIKHELELLREIKKRLEYPICESVQDLTIAIIEPELPKANREYETFIRVYGNRQAQYRGSSSVNIVKGSECPACKGVRKTTVGNAIKDEISKMRSGQMDAQTESDIDYMGDLLARYSKSGKADEEIDCPMCSDWQWLDINQYKNPATNIYDDRIARKYPDPWTMFMDWLWNVLVGAGLNPVGSSGFKNKKDKYGKDVQAPKGKDLWGFARDMVINVESLGNTNLEVHKKLIEVFAKADSNTFFKVEPFPTKEMMDKFDMAASKTKAGDEQNKQAEEMEKFIDENRCFYVTTRVKQSSIEDVLGLPDYDITTPVDMSKLMTRLNADYPVNALAELKSLSSNIQLSPYEAVELDSMIKTAKSEGEDEEYINDVAWETVLKLNPEQSSNLEDALQPVNDEINRMISTYRKEEKDPSVLRDKAWKMMASAASDILNPDQQKRFAKIGARFVKGPQVPASTGAPLRKGEWGRYLSSIKKTGGEARAERSAKAYQSQLGSRGEIGELVDQGIGKEEAVEIAAKNFKDANIAKGKMLTDIDVEYHKQTLRKMYDAEEQKKITKQAAAAASEYPGSKYVYWDDFVDELAEALNSNQVAVELAVSKYMDSLDRFPKPFDFDRLRTDDAVMALNILKTIEPDEISSIVNVAEGYLNGTNAELIILENQSADLGSNRANTLYYEIKAMKNDMKDLLKESKEFYMKTTSTDRLFDSLLKCVRPITKISRIVPVVESHLVFTPTSKEFWVNIFEDKCDGNASVRLNAAKIGEFYRREIDPTLYKSLKNYYNNNANPKLMVAILDGK